MNLLKKGSAEISQITLHSLFLLYGAIFIEISYYHLIDVSCFVYMSHLDCLPILFMGFGLIVYLCLHLIISSKARLRIALQRFLSRSLCDLNVLTGILLSQ